MGKPLAAIDIGSNTIHLLVGRVEDGVVLPLSGERIAVKLASGVGKTGRIESARMRLALDTVRLFTRVAALHGASKPTIIATSAVRDAENGLDLVGAIRVLTENDVRLLTGDAEADLGFKGAMSAVKTRPRDPVLVVDLGGGSAQLAQGEAGYGPRRQVSLPLGTSRTTERYLPQDPPSARQLRTLRKAVLESLPPWELPEDVTAVAVGGSARALLYLQRGDFTAEQLDGFATDISRQQSGVFARECGINPARARVLPAAATTLAAILEHYSISSLTVARTGLREGVLLTLAEGGKI